MLQYDETIILSKGDENKLEVKLESLLTITIKEEAIGKLINELNFLAQIHDFQIDTLLEIRDELHKYYKED